MADVGRPTSPTRLEPFSTETFIQLVCGKSKAAESASVNLQTEYLSRFLSSLQATCLVVEDHYMDRHYMDEFGSYYSRCFWPPDNCCTRIHAFKGLRPEKLDEYLEQAAGGAREVVEHELQELYLGFIVVRPLPTCPIGRTVLKHIDETAHKRFPVVVDYPVHLLGLGLKVRGLAFQQQDGGVAACATTAVWSALQRSCRIDGFKTPTTTEITEAAVSHYLPEGRPFPSTGLTAEQINDALRAFSFPPETLRIGDQPYHFLLRMNAYLRSGIPVILGVYGKDEQGADYGHAVVAVGYKTIENRSIERRIQNAPVALRNLDISRLYVHDDQVGPYAAVRLEAKSGSGWFEKGRSDVLRRRAFSYQRLKMVTEAGGEDRVTWVRQGIVPLYAKIRTSVDDLYNVSMGLTSTFVSLAEKHNDQAGLEVFFQRSGDYQSDLYDAGLLAPELVEFQKRASLSRYIGITRWFVGDNPVVDLIWDTTDVIRPETYLPQSLLGAVVRQANVRPVIGRLVRETIGASKAPVVGPS